MSVIRPNYTVEVSMEANERCLMDTNTLARKLGKSRYWVQTNHRRQGIPSFKIGNGYFFVEIEVESWLQSQRVTSVPSAQQNPKVLLSGKAGKDRHV